MKNRQCYGRGIIIHITFFINQAGYLQRLPAQKSAETDIRVQVGNRFADQGILGMKLTFGNTDVRAVTDGGDRKFIQTGKVITEPAPYQVAFAFGQQDVKRSGKFSD